MRYALFAGDVFYPDGGWNDLICVSATLGEAVDLARANYSEKHKWWHVVDLEYRIVVRTKEED